jgi:hypothetical protein
VRDHQGLGRVLPGLFRTAHLSTEGTDLGRTRHVQRLPVCERVVLCVCLSAALPACCCALGPCSRRLGLAKLRRSSLRPLVYCPAICGCTSKPQGRLEHDHICSIPSTTL